MHDAIDDAVLLGDFERLLEIGEHSYMNAEILDMARFGLLLELTRFMDHHGRQLLVLAQRGANA